MAGRTDCRRYEATLDELIEDDVMAPVLRSAGLDARRFRDLLVDTARRFHERAAENRTNSTHLPRHDQRAKV